MGRVTRDWAVCIDWPGRPESGQNDQKVGRATRVGRVTREWVGRSEWAE